MQRFIDFQGIAGLLSGTASSVNIYSTDSSLLRPLFQNLSFFAQDTWQATPSLTLTYGLRWDYNPPTSETSGHPLFTATNLDDPAHAALAPAGTPLWKATHDNFAPRLGVAYRLRKTSGREMVVRFGSGIFYDLGNGNGASGTGAFPYQRGKTIFNVQYPLSAAVAAAVPFTLNPPYYNAVGFDPHLRVPRTYQWNVGVQQSLGPNQAITATFLGAVGRKLLRSETLVAAAGLNSNFDSINVTTNDGHSNYNAAQIQYQRRISHGLQVLASYTWAHSLDNASDGASSYPYHNVYGPNLDNELAFATRAPGNDRVS